MSERLIIIGAGQAAAQAVQSLRADGFSGPITLIGDEAYAPYQRPPLSKAYLLGSFARERLFLKPDSFYRESECSLILNTRAQAIHRAEKIRFPAQIVTPAFSGWVTSKARGAA